MSVRMLALSTIAVLLGLPMSRGLAETDLAPINEQNFVSAAPTSQPSEQSNPSKQPSHTCKLALLAQAQVPEKYQESIGRVYSVIGNTVMLELEDGSSMHITRTWTERGYLGQLVGKKVAVTDIFCRRIAPAPPPAPVIPQAIQVPTIDFQRRTLQAPPLTPRPVAPPVGPAEETAPTENIIPQTW